MYFRGAVEQCDDGTPVVWVQEEPENMGAWRTFRARFGSMMFEALPSPEVSAATESASPATGSAENARARAAELLEGYSRQLRQ